MNRRLLLAVTTTALVAVATGCDEPSSPCAACEAGDGPQACFKSGGEEIACVTRCEAGCPAGHPCVQNGGALLCSPHCSSESCPQGMECIEEGKLHGSCIGGCGQQERTRCPGAADICDLATRVCFPASGVCDTRADCPHLYDWASSLVEVACVEGFCRARPTPLPRIPALGDADVVVETPARGQAFTSAREVTIRWDGQGHSSIVVVLGTAPLATDAAEHIQQRAVWGVARGPGFVQEARPSIDGFAVVGGTPQDSPGGLQARTALYALVQLVGPGGLLAASAPIPFRIDDRWPGPGDTCTPSASPFGSCDTPARLQTCDQGTCRVTCASHLDCAPWGLACAEPFAAGETTEGHAWARTCR